MIKAYFSWQNIKQLWNLDEIGLQTEVNFCLSLFFFIYLKKDESRHVFSSPLCRVAKWLFLANFLSNLNLRLQVVFIFKSFQVFDFKYLKDQQKFRLVKAETGCQIGLISDREKKGWGQRGRESKRERKVDKSAGFEEVFNAVYFHLLSSKKGTVSIPLHQTVPGLQLIAALQREKGRTGQRDRQQRERGLSCRVRENQSQQILNTIISTNNKHQNTCKLLGN